MASFSQSKHKIMDRFEILQTSVEATFWKKDPKELEVIKH